jgi:hypothetical protein
MPMPSDLREAQRMRDLFWSVGARSFVVTKTELEWPGHKKAKWGRTYSVPELRQKLPAMVRTAAIRRRHVLDDGRIVMAGENLIVRPIGPEVGFVQLDDLKPESLARVRSAAFLVHATSPNNYQAWIAVSDAPRGKEQFKEFVRRVRKAVGGNDKSASHATRLAGTENFKLDYFPDFPVVTIEQAVAGRVMTQSMLQEMGLLAGPKPSLVGAVKKYAPHRASPKGERRWPSYEMSLAGAPLNAKGTGPNRSDADFWWCKLAAQRAFSVEEIAAELPNVSQKARERIRDGDPGYVTKTAENGAAAAARGRQRSRA